MKDEAVYSPSVAGLSLAVALSDRYPDDGGVPRSSDSPPEPPDARDETWKRREWPQGG